MFSPKSMSNLGRLTVCSCVADPGCLSSSPFSHKFDLMRSSRVVKASDCQCRSRNSPGFDPSKFEISGKKQCFRRKFVKFKFSRKQNTVPYHTSLLLSRKKMKLFGRLRTLLYAERHPPPSPPALDHFCLFNVVDNLTGLEGEEG